MAMFVSDQPFPFQQLLISIPINIHPFPFQGVGGTVQLPRGYLKKAYEVVRESGGLCVADEVRAHLLGGLYS